MGKWKNILGPKCFPIAWTKGMEDTPENAGRRKVILLSLLGSKIYVTIYPDTAGPRYLNFLYQLMAIRLSGSSSHFRPGAFHMFYKYTADITYITKSGRKKNKQAQTWVRPKRKKGEVLALFWHSEAIASVYPKEILIQLLILSRKLTWLLGPQVPTSHFSSRPSLTMDFRWLSLTPIC